MEYGITKEGFKRKDRAEVLADMEVLARNLWGDEINLADNSPLGLFIKLTSFELARLWQMAEGIYNATFLNTATGQSLDNIANYLGIKRKRATLARGEVLFIGEKGAVVEAGFMVETGGENSVKFQTTNQENVVLAEIKLDDGRQLVGAKLEVKAVEAGVQGNVKAETITTMTKVKAGLKEVINLTPTQGGQNQESDFELRERYKQSVSAPGGSTLASIKANVLKVAGVRACLIKENSSFVLDSEKRPPKSFETIVLGGDPQEIAKAIFAKKPAGIQAHGKQSVAVEDDAHELHWIHYSEAEEVGVNLKVQLQVDEAIYPQEGNKQVKDAIISYIGGQNSQGEIALGLSLGEKVIYSKLFEVIYSVPGIEDILSLELAAEGEDFGRSNLEILAHQVAVVNEVEVIMDN